MEDNRSVLIKHKKNRRILYNDQEYILDMNNKAYFCDTNKNYICFGLWNEDTKSIILNEIKEGSSSQVAKELLKRKNILLGQSDKMRKIQTHDLNMNQPQN
jgi:hypothetical protein